MLKDLTITGVGIAYLKACTALLIIFLVLKSLKRSWKSYRFPLSRLPGPWYAGFTDIHLKIGFARGTVWKTVEAAHAHYGPLVRLGPRQVWVSDKDALKQIIQQIDLPKVMMYAEISREKESAGLFGEVRPDVHKRLRKLMTPAFTVSYLDRLDWLFQKPVHDMFELYQRQSTKKSAASSAFNTDLMEDLHRVALEIMGEIAFGLGFGSVADDTKPESGFELEAWRAIPDAIIARNPEVRAKLLRTIEPLKLGGDLINWVAVRDDPRYNYLTACIRENLRLHPIASEFGRRTTKYPIMLDEVEISPYTIVSASYRALHVEERNWPEPQRFWPERFLAQDHPLQNGAPPADLSANYPFSGGKHSCIGMNFAWHEMRVILANYFARFDIEEIPKQKLDVRQYITMQFHDGSWKAKLTPRIS